MFTRNLQCPKCGFLAPSKNQLTQHRRKFHGKQTTYAPQVQGQIVANTVTATTTGTNASGKKVWYISSLYLFFQAQLFC